MKQIKKQYLLLFVFAFAFAINGNSQMWGANNCFLKSATVEIGVHTNGMEGSSNLPPFPHHYRGTTGRMGFYANPFDDGWGDYDGDFYLPGYPANSFGIEVAGVTYRNTAPGLATIPSSGLSAYTEVGICKSVEWDGAVAGVDIHMLYSLDTINTYYTVTVDITNTTGTDMTDVFFYKTFDPDNNVDIWGGAGFTTLNTIHDQPTPFCPKSLVTAVDDEAWTSFVGLGAVDPDIRVARGGGLDPSDGSDIYNGVGGLIGTIGFADLDQAIAICHKDAILAAGATSSFTFVVILDESQVEEAILSLYHIDADGADGAAGACTAEFIDVDGDGDLDPLPDTLHVDCAGPAVFLELDGPYLGLGYDITWYNEDTGEIIGDGPTIVVSPTDTTVYKVVASPSGDCFELDIERFFVVAAYGIGPDIFMPDLGPQCGPVELVDLLIEDLEMIPGTFMTFYTEYPDAMDDPTDIWGGGPIGPGDLVYVLIGDPTGGCYDVEEIIIEFVEISAGLDSLGYEMCNSGVLTADLNTFLVDTIYVGEGSLWEEVTPTGGAFDPVTGIFDPTDLAAGDYTFRHIAIGGVVCDDDTSLHTISVYDQPTSGDDGTGSICNETGLSFDLNTLLVGHDPGGFWEETVPTGGAFDPVTAILTVGGALAPGIYDFEYIVLGTDPCVNDTARYSIDVLIVPAVNAGPDQSLCLGDIATLTATGDPATYVWDPAAILNGVPFTPGVGTVTYTVTATGAGGCVNTDDVDIVVHPLPVVSFTADDLEGCTPFQTNFTVVSDVDIASTDWNFGDGDVAEDILIPSVSHTYLFGGIYDVTATVTDIYGCVTSVTYTDYITVEDQPIAAFTMSPQSVYTTDTEVEFTNESLYATDYLWDFGDGSPFVNTENPTHFFPQDPGDVFYPVVLTASNYLGCFDQATLYMNVKGIILFYIPNTFTPDGDQFNELFQPVFESGFDPYDFHMVIYNRWGEVVFESFDATGGWNGAYGNNGLIQDGVYTWKIDFKELHNDKRHTYAGHVNLLK